MPLIVRRRCRASLPWMVWFTILWVLVVFVVPLILFNFAFHLRSIYFYIVYVTLISPFTYVLFCEKVEVEAERSPQSQTTTVDVEMPAFNYSRFGDEHCVICLSNYEESELPALSLPLCGHNFHVECIERWLQSHGRCPICSASPFPSFPPPPRIDVVRVSVAVHAANTREHANF